jgi:ankyrin repeat protein
MNIDEFILFSKKGNFEKIKEYVKNGFSVDVKDELGFSAILEAAEFGHEDIFFYLVNNGADLNIVTNEGFTIEHAVAIGGTPKIYAYLRKNGFEFNSRIKSGDHKGYSVIDYIKYNKSEKMQKVFLEDQN